MDLLSASPAVLAAATGWIAWFGWPLWVTAGAGMTLWVAGALPDHHAGSPARLRRLWLLSSLIWGIGLLVALQGREVASGAAVGFALSVPMLGALMAIDLVDHRLPRQLSHLALFLIAPLLALQHPWGTLLGIGSMVAVVGIFALLSQGSLGFGDLHLAPVLGAIIGWFDPRQVLVAAFVSALAGGVFSGLLLLRGHRRSDLVPFGPFLLGGVMAGIVGAP